ncbi:uncharacterized protein LOC100214685 isoform X1 [Hydra vulgaris]|uniref:Cyclin-dependent kinase 2-associated protein 1 n=1 Tax=Hydra vulgaris TaxID=6087 RepID=T2MJ57_HYDVU|nr:uncharacterized protein LOC100214685 [Hydra vulgaris]
MASYNTQDVKKIELSYKPALQTHHHQPLHYSSPAQVAAPIQTQQQVSRNIVNNSPQFSHQSKYGELLNVIEDLGREIKPTYAGSKMAQERLKKGIMHARTLVRECLAEVDKSARQ